MSDHEWCRDVRRDEAVRAAEDAAAVPAIQHRDLPEVVALLWASVGDLIGRVVRLEGEMDAGQDEEASPAEGLRTERVTLEVTQRVEDYVAPSRWNWCGQLGSHAQPGESVRVVEETKRGRLPDMVARLTAERDAAIRERDEARADIATMRGKCDGLKDRVAELEAAAAPAANAGGESKQEPLAYWVRWLTDKVIDNATFHSTFPTRKAAADYVEQYAEEDDQPEIVPLYAAPQPPRGWLTSEERTVLNAVAFSRYHGSPDWLAITALLARSTPPRVRRPDLNVLTITAEARDRMWFAAIRAAGVEVEG